MLKADQRLSRAEFTRVFTRGKRTHTPFFQLIKGDSAEFKAAVVVPKKVAKQAVSRNQLRRQLYHVLKEQKIEHGSYIVIVKPQARGVSFKEIGAVLQHVVGRAQYSR